ncbi:hypothetical protein ACH495_10665 [Micromonospora sp. NPDC018662]|uniref:hypothetical protein n=1 Tax=Micromonospora sp. NPDC018662 TaxID=3364238 RepID=UPI00378A2ADD
MPHVIRYHGTTPAKLTGWPKYEERLRDAVGIEPSLPAVGVDEATFLAALPQQALHAYEDQCAPANPRMPMLDDMQDLMRAAYHGKGSSPTEA